MANDRLIGLLRKRHPHVAGSSSSRPAASDSAVGVGGRGDAPFFYLNLIR
jgi:hypothetical protein